MLFTISVYTIGPVSSLDTPFGLPKMITIVRDIFFVLCSYKHPSMVMLGYEDSIPRDPLMMTFTEKISRPHDMVGIDASNLYVSDRKCRCIWKVDAGVDKWLELDNIFSLSVASDNQHLLVLRLFEDLLYLESYDQNARLMRNVALANDCSHPFSAIQEPNGELIVSHSFKRKSENLLPLKVLDKHVSYHGYVWHCNYLIDPFHTVKEPNAGFIVSHRSEYNSGNSVSFISTDRCVSHFTLQKTVALNYTRVELFLETDSDKPIAGGQGNGNKYLPVLIGHSLSMVSRFRSMFPFFGDPIEVYYDRKKEQLIARFFTTTVYFYKVNEK